MATSAASKHVKQKDEENLLRANSYNNLTCKESRITALPVDPMRP